MKTTTNIWIRGLAAAVITGGSSSGLAALGVTIADAAGVAVGALNIKQVGIMFLSGALVGLLAYLKQSPVPPVE